MCLQTFVSERHVSFISLLTRNCMSSSLYPMNYIILNCKCKLQKYEPNSFVMKQFCLDIFSNRISLRTTLLIPVTPRRTLNSLSVCYSWSRYSLTWQTRTKVWLVHCQFIGEIQRWMLVTETWRLLLKVYLASDQRSIVL